MIKAFKGKNPNLEKFFIPKSVQQSIPIKKVYKDGILSLPVCIPRPGDFTISTTP